MQIGEVLMTIIIVCAYVYVRSGRKAGLQKKNDTRAKEAMVSCLNQTLYFLNT